MTQEEFIKNAKEYVQSVEPENKGINLVWFNYTLKNMKCLLIAVSDKSYYYEVTYDSANNRVYYDTYSKKCHAVLNLNAL